MPWKEYDVMDQKLTFVLKSFTKDTSFTELCTEFGISTKTGYKWKERFFADGVEGLKEKSRKPKKNPKELSEAVVCDLIRIKKTKTKWGPKKIRFVFAENHKHESIPSLSTVERILRRAGFVESRRKRKKFDPQRIQNRVVPEQPNDVWTVDFKGWWYTPEHERCEPLTVRDEKSKYILAITILEKGNITCVKGEFERIFARFGLPKTIRSDNGPPFASPNAILGLTRLATWWMSLGIKLDRIDPGSPYQNGAHERMHLDMKKELEGKISGSLKMHQHVFDVWRKEFNTERPHEGLGMKKPADVYKRSERKYEGPIEGIEYPGGYISRQVNDRGYINHKGKRIFLTNALGGFNVGLRADRKGSVEVWFGDNHLGKINLQTFVFETMICV
jgi:putative transposase